MGVQCPRAYLEIPIADITPHPEYSRFGVGNSLALLKLIRPIKSHYMVPICLPSIDERIKKQKHKLVFMVDYISLVPRDFDTEKLAKRTMKMYTHRECRRHRMRTGLGSEGVTHVLCSSGCGVRPGAPIIIHAAEGPFQLIGIAAGGGVCTRRSMRNRLNIEPPLYIDIYPYISWIINFITATVLPRPYPETFQLVDGGSLMGVRKEFLRTRRPQKTGWRARTYVKGDYCYRTPRRLRATTAFFYSETFEVNADPPGKIHVVMQLSAGIECTIVCVRLTLPNRLTTPSIEGVGGYNITVTIESMWFPLNYYFGIGINGKNTTARDFDRWLPERSPGFW